MARDQEREEWELERMRLNQLALDQQQTIVAQQRQIVQLGQEVVAEMQRRMAIHENASEAMRDHLTRIRTGGGL